MIHHQLFVSLIPALILALLRGAGGQTPQSTATVSPLSPMANGMPTGYGTSTQTQGPGHPFCTQEPPNQNPKIPIYHMDIRSGFPDGYRLNQTVIGEFGWSLANYNRFFFGLQINMYRVMGTTMRSLLYHASFV